MHTKKQQKLMKVIGFLAILTIVFGMILPYVSLGTTAPAQADQVTTSILNETQVTQVEIPSNKVTVK